MHREHTHGMGTSGWFDSWKKEKRMKFYVVIPATMSPAADVSEAVVVECNTGEDARRLIVGAEGAIYVDTLYDNDLEAKRRVAYLNIRAHARAREEFERLNQTKKMERLERVRKEFERENIYFKTKTGEMEKI